MITAETDVCTHFWRKKSFSLSRGELWGHKWPWRPYKDIWTLKSCRQEKRPITGGFWVYIGVCSKCLLGAVRVKWFNSVRLKLKVLVAQLCLTLCNPIDCSPPGSSVHGFPRQEYWRGLPCPPAGDLPDLGIEPGLPHCRQIFYCLSHQGSGESEMF